MADNNETKPKRVPWRRIAKPVVVEEEASETPDVIGSAQAEEVVQPTNIIAKAEEASEASESESEASEAESEASEEEGKPEEEEKSEEKPEVTDASNQFAKLAREWQNIHDYHSKKEKSLALFLREKGVADSKKPEQHQVYIRHVQKNTQALKAPEAERLAWIAKQVELYKAKEKLAKEKGAKAIRTKKGANWLDTTVIEPQDKKAKDTKAKKAEAYIALLIKTLQENEIDVPEREE